MEHRQACKTAEKTELRGREPPLPAAADGEPDADGEGDGDHHAVRAYGERTDLEENREDLKKLLGY